ncbi:hypothetical protein BGZ95_008262 [Linnemannia exigua]|uniref:Uncharacterized protein n=1 Tax=Linnemannia exigua TaxID=604196 RepID=A0AAD4H7V0_9FUNG|nr:hypothetical protein BGZ95_008262 [Linnemannia exigua]
MPAATFNRERTVGSQLPGGATRTSQGFQDAIVEESQDPRQVAPHVISSTAGAPFGLVDDGSAQANFDNFMMGIALDQPVDISGFSRASQGNNGSNYNVPASTTTATGATTATINQTQLLSGSRS